MQDLVRSDYNRTSANFQDLDISGSLDIGNVEFRGRRAIARVFGQGEAVPNDPLLRRVMRRFFGSLIGNV